MNKYTPRRTPLAATIGSVLATGSLHAATITVDTVNDTVVPGECSLRAAIESANTGMAAGGCDPGTPDADEIIFDEGLAGSVITLGGGLVIENSLTITGPGADQLTIDGDESYRHFDVGLGKYQEVIISGITLANGYAAGDGGAIRMQITEGELRNREFADRAQQRKRLCRLVYELRHLVHVDRGRRGQHIYRCRRQYRGCRTGNRPADQ